MLIEFRVSNHRSIREEQALTMEVGRTTASDDIRSRAVEGSSTPLLPVAAIYGANASGKSNVISAINFFVRAVAWSHRMWEPEGGVPRDPFAWAGGRDAPSVFECTFVHDGVRFDYGFAVSDEVCLEEWLYAWPSGRKQMWFERELQAFKFGEHLHGENRLVERTTRPNSLFLSAAAQNQHEQLSRVFSWFRRARVAMAPERRSDGIPEPMLVSFLGLDREDPRQLSLFTQDGTQRDERIEQVIDLLRAADTGIVDLKVVAKTRSDTAGMYSRQRPEIFLRHRSRVGEAWLPLREESSGTKTLLGLALNLSSAVHVGGLLVVDELEASLHPLLGQHLVRLFNDPSKNRHNAQLIFTTHDTNLLGTSLGPPELQRDQVWLTEKDDDGATRLYPLTDYKPRKAENIETGYLQGRYGSIPFLGDLSTVGE